MSSRTLELPDSWKRRLLHLRILCGTQSPAEVTASEVERVEKELGVKLGDCMLALLACGGSLMHEFEVRLAMLPGHTRYAHGAGLSRGLVGIGRSADGEVLIGASSMGTRITRFEVTSGHSEAMSGEEWLDELIQEQQLRLRDAADTKRARGAKPVTPADVEAFAPCVVTRDDRERVVHTKFGEGQVLRELGDGKVEVEFEGGIKTLMRSFLQPA